MVSFTTFPRTQPPPLWAASVIGVFRAHEAKISTPTLSKGLTSDGVLRELGPDLTALGFDVEEGKLQNQRIRRPVFFGENGEPALQYEVDGYHREWRCGLEIEAGRSWMGNAVYRDLIQALVMVEVDWLCLAVPLAYKYRSGSKDVVNKAYENTVSLADAVFGHSRISMPYSLLVVGY